MTKDPFRIEGPALISFSGGRTSAYMLWRIVQAHGGKLPADVHVCFANTGDEREETLRFVYECGARWGVRIRWLEWRDTRRAYAGSAMACDETFEEVGFNSASRNGEPFDALIDRKQRLPNWQERWCTEHLKVVPVHAFMRAVTGLEPGMFVEAIGLRNDEGWRILKGLARAKDDGRHVVYPLAKAKVDEREVLRFWLGENADPLALIHPLPQGFDLGLAKGAGNCTLCFAMGRVARKGRIRDRPQDVARWHAREVRTGGTFDPRDSVADLVAEVRQQPDFFVSNDDEFDVECGLQCAPA